MWPMPWLDLLQYVGVALSLTGAFLVSGSTARRRRQGFAIWIGSNVLLLTWAAVFGAWGLWAMYLVFTFTSAWGFRNNR